MSVRKFIKTEMVVSRVEFSFFKTVSKPNSRQRFEHRIFEIRFFAATLFMLALVILSPAQTIEIAAVGDVLLSRGVERKIEKFGAEYPFANVKEILSGADFAFGNLENPLSAKCPKSAKKYQFQAKPGSAKILADAGFDILSLANNHSLDCGEIGLFQTFESLAKTHLQAIGAGETINEAESPVYFEAKGIRIGFLAFTAILPDFKRRNYPNLAVANVKSIANAVVETRKYSDVVIISFHWGTEYASRPNAEQIELANAAIEAGADVILGHHPHVLQGFSVAKNGGTKRKTFVAYSLGNFVFDSPKSLIKQTAESVILKIRIGKNGFESAEAIPLMIENYRPVIAVGDSKKLILNRLNQLSENWEQ